MPSASNTVISLPGQQIIDASGNAWSIVDGQVAINGVVDSTTSGVIEMAYENGTVWQKNAHNLWWGKPTPSAAWSPPLGTAVDPIPNQVASPDKTVTAAGVSGGAGIITDASGNAWSIVNGQVTLNGVADRSTANVIEMAYVNGQIWQENAAALWWSKTTPASAWGPPYGTSVNPVQGVDLAFSANAGSAGAVYNVGALQASAAAGTPGSTSLSLPQGTASLTTTGVQLTNYDLQLSALAFAGPGPLIIDGNSSLTAGSTLSFRLLGTGGLPPGPMQNNGTMVVSGSTLQVGALTGSGVITATANSTLDILDADTGETIQLRSAHLFIGGAGQVNPGLTFLAPITGFGASSAITLDNTTATEEVFVKRGLTAGELYLYDGPTIVADLLISGQASLYATQANGSVTITAPNPAVTPSTGVLPIVGSANDTVLVGPSGRITDSAGGVWTITSGHKVAYGGVAIAPTANVIELAYVGGVVWQESAGDIWSSIVHSGSVFSTGAEPTAANPVQGINLDLQAGSSSGAVFNVGTLAASSGSATIRIPNGAANLIAAGVALSGAALTVEDYGGAAPLTIAGNSTLAAGARLTMQQLGAQTLPAGPVVSNGTMTVSASSLDIGSLSGAGTISATGGSNLEIGSAGAGETVQLTAATLYIGGGAGGSANPGLNFLAPITQFGAASSIELFQTDATRAVFNHTGPTAGELLLYDNATKVADLHISGQASIYAAFNSQPAFGPYGSVMLTATDSGHSLPG